MDTVVFGNLTWEVMNYVAFLADSSKEKSLHQKALLILASLTLLIPCEPCRRFYLTCWCIHPPKPGVSLCDWVYDIHSIVTAKIKVTKSHLIKPTECLAPALSRQELQRRFHCLGRGANLSMGALLDFILITAHGAKRHSKDHRRAQAWKVMVGALHAFIGLDPYAQPLAKAMEKLLRGKDLKRTTSPWHLALLLSDKTHEALGPTKPSHASITKRLDEGCGPLCKWLEERL